MASYYSPQPKFYYYYSSLIILCLSTLLFRINSQPAPRNISLGSSLTAGAASKDYWLSPSGEFAFGFQQVAGSSANGFLLAIWYNKIAQKTIVWSANRNELVSSGSTVKLTKDGSLMLADPSGRQIWGPNGVGAGVSYGALFDTGNFVLANRNAAVLWGSFDQPTDTILPTQIVKRGTELISKYSSTNYSTGRFKFTLQNDGNLVAYTTFYPQTGSNFPYWAGNIAGNSVNFNKSGYRVMFNQSGLVYLMAKNETVLSYPLGTDGESTQDFFQRATMDFDGVFRKYLYPKSNTSSGGSGWAMRWNTQAIQPPNICTSVRGLFGGGACGVNSYCHMESGREENAASPSCKCPPRYVFMDPSDESKGCMKNFASHDCRAESNGSGDDQFDIMEIPSTNWPDFFYDQLESQTEGMCRQACLSDCLCDVAIFFGGFCWKKRMPLTNGRMEEGASVKALIKVGRSNSSSLAYPRKKDESSLKLTGGLLIGSSVFLNLLLLSTTLLFFSWWRRNNKRGQLHPTSSVNLLSFSYSQLESATGGFKEVLGRGASATVYKGILQNVGETITIAVKKMDKLWGVEEGEDDNREFTTEVKVIAGTNHKNLVKLVGVCSEGKNHLLVYEYMSNGSLASLLFKADPRPNWYTRAQIAISVARGLVYLHEECSTQIIHCDIKPQNILLDESLTAKISDFGLAKLLKVEQTRTMTAIRGTKGYVAPEWFRNMAITTKVDVYSFGVVLLELVCCRRGFEMEGYEEEEMVLVDWAHECYGDRMVGRLVEKDEEAMKDLVKVERFVKIGLWCVQEDPCLRPEMKKVVHMLEGAVEVSVPPSPASYINTV
ncbi:unnamed protein product [Linum tenue]|uniref:Receptor-like serine/threonine-protein kinase n=1 Tax=Linum tenue TaxID=586396 RepID=A0AAV0REI4_9ROSI|nr:unnamed protein product [Linum tenue]